MPPRFFMSLSAMLCSVCVVCVLCSTFLQAHGVEPPPWVAAVAISCVTAVAALARPFRMDDNGNLSRQHADPR